MKLKSKAEDERRKATIDRQDKIKEEEPFDIEVWTDGLATGGTTDGGGGAVVTTRVWNTILRTPAGRHCSSYQAELKAISMALEYVNALDEEHGNKLTIMTDSKSSMEKLAIGPENQDSDFGIYIWKALIRPRTPRFYGSLLIAERPLTKELTGRPTTQQNCYNRTDL